MCDKRIDPLAGPGVEEMDEDTRRVLASSRTSGPKKTVKIKSDRRRAKATYDLPAALQEAITAIAESESCSRSAVAAWALGRFVADYRHGEEAMRAEMQADRRAINALRWRYTLVLHADEW